MDVLIVPHIKCLGQGSQNVGHFASGRHLDLGTRGRVHRQLGLRLILGNLSLSRFPKQFQDTATHFAAEGAKILAF